MKLYRVEPYYNQEQGEAKYLAALDESHAIEMVEWSEPGAILEDDSDYYMVNYEVVYVKDLENQPDLCKWGGKDIFRLTDEEYEEYKVCRENGRKRMLLEEAKRLESEVQPFSDEAILRASITCFFLLAWLYPQLVTVLLGLFEALITAAGVAFFFILVFMNGLND